MSVDAGRRARPPRELAEQLAGVDEVAVVADRERPPRPQAVRRLGVLPDRRAGRRVAAVGDRQAARAGSAGGARRGPSRSSRGPCRASAARRRSPRRRPIPGRDAGARTGRARRSPPPRSARRRARPTPNTPHIGVSPPSRGPGRGRGPTRGEVARAGTSGRPRPGCPAPPTRRSRRRRRARSRAGRRRPSPSASTGSPCWRASSVRAGAYRGVAVTTTRDGLSPNSSTAGDPATATRTAPRGRPDRGLGERHRQPAAGHVLGARRRDRA